MYVLFLAACTLRLREHSHVRGGYPGHDTPEPETLELPGRTAAPVGAKGCYAAALARCTLLLALVLVFPVFFKVPSTLARKLNLPRPCRNRFIPREFKDQMMQPGKNDLPHTLMWIPIVDFWGSECS